MRTKLTPNINISDRTYGKLYKDLDVKSLAPGIEIPVYIQRYMTASSFTKPKTKKVTLSTNIFKNKNNTRPKFSNNKKQIQTQNYITASLQDTEFMHVVKEKKDKQGNVTKVYVPKGTRVVVTFVRGKTTKAYASFILY